MTPKTIHCCWLGDAPMTRLAERCRTSWARFAPDFSVRVWTLKEVEALGVPFPPYVREALARRKWAFAADWMRFLILERAGGVYFDTDLELVAPLDRAPDVPWIAGEKICRDTAVGYNPCALALPAGHPFARRMLDFYTTLAYDPDRTVGDWISICYGAPPAAPVPVLPPEAFCPFDWKGHLHTTSATIGIHRCAQSWVTPRRRLAGWLNRHGLSRLVDLLLAIRDHNKPNGAGAKSAPSAENKPSAP